LYWRYEKSIRRHESAIDSTVGATGAIYAIRRSLFELVPEDTVLDDVLIPLRIANRGYRTLFESAARAHDRAPSTAAEEFRRKVRTIAGNFQLFARHPWLFSPRANRLWFQTLSHKGLRLLTPALLGTAMAANLSLAASPFYRAILAAQLAFYAAALVGFALRDVRGKAVFMGPCMICILSWATVVAFLRFTSGGQPAAWEKSTSG
jgi:poly-beta-1,6-N-acetyl-D-glucosamine synthase